MTAAIFVYVTAPDLETAERIGASIVEEGLAACANLLPGMRSIYRWKEKVEDTAEWLLLIKSRRDLLPALRSEIQKLHTYEVPEIIALPITSGAPTYLEWLVNSTVTVPPRATAASLRKRR